MDADKRIALLSDFEKLNKTAMVSVYSMEKAKVTMMDFVESFFMFHNLHPHDFFDYLPLLTFVECVMYQIDDENESKLSPQSASKTTPASSKAPALPPSKEEEKEEEADDEEDDDDEPKSTKTTTTAATTITTTPPNSQPSKNKEEGKVVDPFITSFGASLKPYFYIKPVAAMALSLMDKHKILDQRIFNLVNKSVEYLKIERMLCGEGGEKLITMALVDKAIRIKNVDYNILNHVLFKLRGEEYDEFVIYFFEVLYVILLIDEDIRDYEKDILANSFNCVRMFVRLYGKDGPKKLFEYLKKFEDLYHPLYAQLTPEMQEKHDARCRVATVDELGKHQVTPYKYQFEGHLSWEVYYCPEPILNEEEWRKNRKPKPKPVVPKSDFNVRKPNSQWKKSTDKFATIMT